MGRLAYDSDIMLNPNLKLKVKYSKNENKIESIIHNSNNVFLWKQWPALLLYKLFTPLDKFLDDFCISIMFLAMLVLFFYFNNLLHGAYRQTVVATL